MGLSSFAGGRLWGARYGTSPAKILGLHGWARGHSDFDPVLEGMEAVALDLPGFGVTPEPPASWTTAEYARHVSSVLDEMADGPLVVVGHSFGGRVAAWLVRLHGPQASAQPGRRNHISALVLTGAPLAPFPGSGPGRPALGYRAGRALHRAHLMTEARMERLRQRYGSDDYRRASPLMRGVLVKAVAETAASAYVEPVAEFAAAGGTVVLVWGERDTVASLEGTRRGLGLGEESVRVVRGAGHILSPHLSIEVRAAVRQLAYPEQEPAVRDAGPLDERACG